MAVKADEGALAEALAEALTAALAELRRDGTVTEIFRRHGTLPIHPFEANMKSPNACWQQSGRPWCCRFRCAVGLCAERKVGHGQHHRHR